MATTWFVLLLALHTLGATPPATAPQIRVLFIGNSLTVANDLPAMVERLADQAGISGEVVCGVVAKPNFGLEEHWQDGEALRILRRGSWTHVVLQQGPSSLPESRTVLRQYTGMFAEVARAQGANVILFGVWPARDRLAFQKEVTESYRLAAADVGGEMVPVGEAWRLAWEKDAQLPLYGPDGFHPSPLGTYAGALMLFEKLTGRTASGSKPPRGVKVDKITLKIVQDAAHAAGR